MAKDSVLKNAPTFENLINKGDLSKQERDFLEDVENNSPRAEMREQYLVSCVSLMEKSSNSLPYDEFILGEITSRFDKSMEHMVDIYFACEILQGMNHAKQIRQILFPVLENMHSEMKECHGGMREYPENHKNRKLHTALDHKSYLLLLFAYIDMFAQVSHYHFAYEVDASGKQTHKLHADQDGKIKVAKTANCWVNQYLKVDTKNYFGKYIKKGVFYDMRSHLVHASLLTTDYFSSRDSIGDTYQELKYLFVETAKGMNLSYSKMSKIFVKLYADFIVALFLDDRTSCRYHLDRLHEVVENVLEPIKESEKMIQRRSNFRN